MSQAGVNLPLRSQNEYNLAIAEIAIYGVLFPPAVWITWRHGKAGLTCWPIVASYFVLRFVADIYEITHRADPIGSSKLPIYTNAGSIACLTLGLIGILYEINTIIPTKSRHWLNNAMLGLTHLINTSGIGLVAYGGTPKASSPGEINSHLMNQIGACMMLAVIFMVFWWLVWSGRRFMAFQTHPNIRSAKLMLRAAYVGLPFQLVRLVYVATYSFNRIPSLDPAMGTFATKLILIFLMQLCVVIPLLVGGWFGRHIHPKAQLALQTREFGESEVLQV